MATKTTDPHSEFFRITWNETNTRDQRYQLGQHFKDSYAGNLIVYSIDETSHVKNANVFTEQYTVKVITEKGEIIEWYCVRNPKNITLLRNFTEYLEL